MVEQDEWSHRDVRDRNSVSLGERIVDAENRMRRDLTYPGHAISEARADIVPDDEIDHSRGQPFAKFGLVTLHEDQLHGPNGVYIAAQRLRHEQAAERLETTKILIACGVPVQVHRPHE